MRYTRIMLRKVALRCFGRPKNIIVVPFLVGILFVVWCVCWWAAEVVTQVLLPPSPVKDLRHFRRTRSLKDYIDNIQVLIEPSSTPCSTLKEIPLLTLVTSAPHRVQHRHAIRQTWAKYQPTFFVLGYENDDLLSDNYVEAKQHSDMVVFDFHDHYQNLTLKTALMLHWALTRCPNAQYLFKTDDDVVVNPWTLKTVVKDNANAELIGYSIVGTYPHRDIYTKWYMPRWLYPEDIIPKYLSGTGYIVNGKYIKTMVKKANQVPLVNLEDVYWTYLVGNQALHYNLTHEQRLSPFRPIIPHSCAYWTLASAHSFLPEQMVQAFSKIEYLAYNYNVTTVCKFYESYLAGDWLLRR